MKKIFCLFLCLLILGTVVFAKGEVQYGVYDDMEVLTESELADLNAKLSAFASEKEVNAFIYLVPRSYYQGKDFLAQKGISESEDTFLICVTVEYGTYYFDCYTYGKADQRISDSELEEILDSGMPIKRGFLANGLSNMILNTHHRYESAGVHWGSVIKISLILSAIGAGVFYLTIVLVYRRKNRGASYPLESYTQLTLTAQEDRFLGTFVTKTRIVRSSSSGGGRSSHGGGSGHRGGR